MANISTIHKGGDRDHPGNFRPISVVPITAKVLEKLISDRLLNYFETHHLLYDHQGAYHCGISSDQIFNTLLIRQFLHGLNQGLAVCSAFSDFRKAFDSLDYLILLKRLHQLDVCSKELK